MPTNIHGFIGMKSSILYYLPSLCLKTNPELQNPSLDTLYPETTGDYKLSGGQQSACLKNFIVLI